MTPSQHTREPQAHPDLKSQWDQHLDVPESFWAQSEEASVRAALPSSKRRFVMRPWAALAAACVVGGMLIGTWGAQRQHDACVTFACLWEAQADIPWTEDELDMLEEWESGYDDLLFDSTSF